MAIERSQSFEKIAHSMICEEISSKLSRAGAIGCELLAWKNGNDMECPASLVNIP
jgi:hypothetical protein